ncbi:MAG: choice-of-anchor D domain-containing protein [Bacteroidota bacterium]|nr:choice-of-anchor D domain-containing protein [Bacteroidota bacterium]
MKKYILRRSILSALVFAFGTFFLVDYATSHSGGITGYTNKSGDAQGCSCHCATSNANTTVTIATAATSFQVNQTYTFTITVANTGETNAGCDIACNLGSLSAGNDGLQKIGSQLTHTAPKGLPATWTFTYTAPATAGTDVIYAAGNAVNADGTNSCADQWNFATSYNITVTAPTIAYTVSTSSLSFGSKRVGTTTNQTMTVNSVGPDAALTISSSPLSVGAMFSTSPTGSNRNVNVGSSETETITFSPTARGAFYDTLTLNTNATSSADQHRKIYISGTGINGVFSGASSIQFDNVRVGGSKQLTYNITNTGEDTLFLSAPNISGAGFSIIGGTAQNILPGGSGSVVVKFSPTIKQIYTGTLSMTAQNNVTVPTISIAGNGTAPILSLASSNYDMGVTLVGGILSGSLQITNTGNDTLHVTSVSITQTGTKFVLGSGAGFILLPGASSYIGFTYSSPSESTDNATLIINCDDPAGTTRQVALSAKSGLPKMSVDTKDTIDFGNVRIGGHASSFLTITNLGTYNLNVQINQFFPDVFSGGSNIPAVPPQGNVAAELIFSPTAEGPITGMAVIHSNDDKNSTDTIYMKGAGINTALDFPSAIDFHELNINKTRDTVLTLRNAGSGAAKIFRYVLTDTSKGFVLLDTAAHTINPKDSVTITVRFAPKTEVTFFGAISIVTDDGVAPTRVITLTGRGINSKLSTNVPSIDFGEIDSGSTSTKTFTITNTGSAPTTINYINLTGDTAFSRGSLTLPMQLAAGGSQDVSITFSPMRNGQMDGTAVVTASEGSPISVALHGKGKVIVVVGAVRNDPAITGLKMTISQNPTNGSARINLILSKPLDLKLALFDASGRFIRSYDHTVNGIGEFSVPLNAETLASGEYSLHAISGGAIVADSKIMIIR